MLAVMEHRGLDARGTLTSLGKLRALAQSMALRWRKGPAAGQPVRDCPPLPTGVAARKALAWSAESSPPWLHAHVLRTYCWGQLLGEAAGLQPDAELLFVACALHDLGLTELYAPEPGECFAFAGARHARKLLVADGVPQVWAERVADAIALHLDVHVALTQGVEAKLLSNGAALDVLGVGGRGVAPDTRRAVLRAYSREGFGPKLAEAVLAAARNAPGSREAFYCERGNFAGRAAKTRLPEEAGL
jgi:hypothetical protein